jgi:hypothetical protein
MDPKLERYIDYIVDHVLDNQVVYDDGDNRVEFLFFTNEDYPNWFHETEMRHFEGDMTDTDWDDAFMEMLQHNYGVRNREEANMVYLKFVKIIKDLMGME